jgi:hypothetical protein
MSTVQAMMLGVILALAPSLLLVVILFWRWKSRTTEDEHKPSQLPPRILPAAQPRSNTSASKVISPFPNQRPVCGAGPS